MNSATSASAIGSKCDLLKTSLFRMGRLASQLKHVIRRTWVERLIPAG